MNSRGTFARIDLSVLRRNAQALRERLSPHAFFCPMVKANAYGHGAVAVAKELQDLRVDAVGVVTIEEAMELRQSGLTIPILILGTPAELRPELWREHKLTVVVSDLEVLRQIYRTNVSIHIHLKLNTGMNRMGLLPSEIREALSLIESNPKVRLKGVLTHFLNGEDIQDAGGYSRKQIDLFRQVHADLGSRLLSWHLYNSASLLRLLPATSNDPFLKTLGARPGISLYGETPFQDSVSGLEPVLELHSQIAHFHSLRSGEVVSYGARWKADRPSIIGVVPIGYADGYPRILTNRAPMLVQGLKVPVVGTVCMDFVMIDLTDHPQRERMRRGEPVVVIGQQGDQRIRANDLAHLSGTIPYEILTGLGNRITRSYVGGQAK